MEDLGDGLYKTVLGRIEQTDSADAWDEDNEVVHLEDGERIDLPRLESGNSLQTCLCMALAHFDCLHERTELSLPGEEMSFQEIEAFLNTYGLEAIRCTDTDVNLLLDAVEHNESVICFVSAAALYWPELDIPPELADRSAVSVVGFDFSDPFSVCILVHDPQTVAAEVSWALPEFSRSWKQAGGNALVIRRRNSV